MRTAFPGMIWPRITLLILALALVAGLATAGCKKKAEPKNESKEPTVQPLKETKSLPGPAEKQEPVVAGRFYPADPTELKTMIQGFLSRAQGSALAGRPLGFMVPHAGYEYSGPVAAYVYKTIRDLGARRFVIMGPSHGVSFQGVYALDKDFYHTPLGDARIDRESVKKLLGARAWISSNPALYGSEHSVEAQIPFLQEAAGPDISIVPLVIGSITEAQAADLAQVLDDTFAGSDVIFIASTDMSHGNYPPYKSSDDIKPVDLKTLFFIKAMDSNAIAKGIRDDSTPLCGGMPVLTLMNLARRHHVSEAQVLKYADSGDATGDHRAVVGYGAVAFVLPAGEQPSAAPVEPAAAEGGSFRLTEAEKIELLKMARAYAEAAVKKGSFPSMEPGTENLKRIGAAFVTLKNAGQLRGCIGSIIPDEPLYRCVQRRAVDAAVHDSRFVFNPITPQELASLEIEISVLTPLERVKSFEDVVVGRDGVLLTLGPYRGVFLPQVPTEQGWDRETYLSELCHKAGIGDPDCFRNPQAVLERFEAIVFSEHEFGL